MKTEALIRELAGQVRPVSPLRRPGVRFAGWAAVAVAWLALGVGTVGLRADLAVVARVPAFWVDLALPVLLGLATIFAAFVASVPGGKRRGSTFVVAVALATWLALVGAELALGDHGRAAGPGLKCVRNLVAFSTPPGALLYVLLGRAAPLERGWTGLLAALGTAALAHAGTRFVCHNDGALHILVWHCACVLLLGGMGMLIGRALFK
jgi:hypothetical protein